MNMYPTFKSSSLIVLGNTGNFVWKVVEGAGGCIQLVLYIKTSTISLKNGIWYNKGQLQILYVGYWGQIRHVGWEGPWL